MLDSFTNRYRYNNSLHNETQETYIGKREVRKTVFSNNYPSSQFDETTLGRFLFALYSSVTPGTIISCGFIQIE